MFSFVVESERVVIDAPAESVWNIILDAEHYPEWNPFTPRIDTDFVPGSPIRMHVPLGSLTLKLTEYIQEVEPPLRIAWGKDFGARVLLTASKTQHVTPINDKTCSYYTTDRMTGLLAPFVRLLFARWVLRGFDDTGRALKQRCEAP
ncbi:MAG: SRPBCC domain-containing protein [Gammaproteobacteria bacterium]|nr:SRPBCC domain-containing protein [Gammaproteobacteria bacterium]